MQVQEMTNLPKLMGMQLVTEEDYRRFVAEKQHVKIENVNVEIGRPWRIKEFGPPKDYKSEEFTVWSFLVEVTGRPILEIIVEIGALTYRET